MNAKQYRKERDKVSRDYNKFYEDVYFLAQSLKETYPDSLLVKELNVVVENA